MANETTDWMCTHCAFWKHIKSDIGECRRHAPRAIAGMTAERPDGHLWDAKAYFPETNSDDWCGEYREMR